MKMPTNLNRGESDDLVGDFLRNQEHPVRHFSALHLIFRHVNAGTLAVIMFLTLAVLNTIRGTEFEPGNSAPVKTTTRVVSNDFNLLQKTHPVVTGRIINK